MPSGDNQVHHGHSFRGLRTKTYRAWCNMKTRCRFNPDYTTRGIKVCERWEKFKNFLADMGEAPAGLTLERKDNDRDYEPGNCIWADWRTQRKNQRPKRTPESYVCGLCGGFGHNRRTCKVSRNTQANE